MGHLHDRATLALYTPGSTFKVLTLASALENGLATLDTTYDSPGVEIGGADVVSIGERGHGKISLAKAFALSSNTVFGQVADGLGAEKLVATARAFGLRTAAGLDFHHRRRAMPEEMTEWELAWAAGPSPARAQPAGHCDAKRARGPGPRSPTRRGGEATWSRGSSQRPRPARGLGQAVSSGTAAQVQQAMLDVVRKRHRLGRSNDGA